MEKLIAQIVLAGLASAFAGILLFIAEVLSGIFNSLEPAAFQALMALLFKRASRSIVLTVTGAGPALAVIAYLFVFGFGDHLFLLGIAIFWLSLVASNLINVRIYRSIQSAGPEETHKISVGRLAICRANWLRAALAALGAATMFVAILLRG